MHEWMRPPAWDPSRTARPVPAPSPPSFRTCGIAEEQRVVGQKCRAANGVTGNRKRSHGQVSDRHALAVSERVGHTTSVVCDAVALSSQRVHVGVGKACESANAIAVAMGDEDRLHRIRVEPGALP